jgi:hypothetical protein
MIYKVNIVKKSKKNSFIKAVTTPIHIFDKIIKANKESIKNLSVLVYKSKSKNHYQYQNKFTKIKIKILTTIIIKNKIKNKHPNNMNMNIITIKLPSLNLIIIIELKHKAKNISNPTTIITANFNKINDHKKDLTMIFITIIIMV